MNSFAAWGLTILALAIVTTVAEMLLPKGKTKTVIRSVVATVTVLAVITPIPSLIKGEMFSFDFESGAVETDEDYLSYVDGMKKTAIEKSVTGYLEDKGYRGIKVSVELDGVWRVKSASLDFSQSGITDKDSHIHKNEVIKLVAECLQLNEEAIMTYG
ncbi:MAG: hypothetical protein J1F39_00580 [Clostridiales bacterium]|nr:hypothetical protein [Clostridiales bacterium]